MLLRSRRMEALDDEPGVLWVEARPYVHAYYFVICDTILSAKNFNISSGRSESTRIAVLFPFIVVHADWNLHMFKDRRFRRLRLLLW